MKTKTKRPTFKCDCQKTRYGHQAGCRTYKAIYPEIHIPNDPDAPAPEFPATCPACGAEKIGEVTAASHWECRADYACGGHYILKSQTQNHTNKWWGICGHYDHNRDD